MEKYFECSKFVEIALAVDVKLNYRSVVIDILRKNNFHYYVDLKYDGQSDKWRAWLEKNNNDLFCMYYIAFGGRELIFFRKGYDAMAFKLMWL